MVGARDYLLGCREHQVGSVIPLQIQFADAEENAITVRNSMFNRINT